MMWQQRDGLWVLGDPVDAAPPEIQAVEALGALLEWPLGADVDAVPVITVLDAEEADWLWQLIGEPAHVALLGDGDYAPEWDLALVRRLRKLAHGLWLRDWWPTSLHDGIPALSRHALALEMAELVAELEGVVDDERFAPVEAAHLTARADYALAASGRLPEDVAEDGIATGRATVAWQGVPAGVVDATEYPVAWGVDAAPDPVLHVVVLTVAAPSSAAGLAVRVEHPTFDAVSGALDEDATSALALPLTPPQAWTTDWETLDVSVGVPVSEPAELRQRIRRFARGRLASRDELTYVAEVVDDD